MPQADGYEVEKLKDEVEREVAATIKLIMLEMERLASAEPHVAADPMAFNAMRRVVIRKVWNLSKECIRYGAKSVQRDQPYD